MLKFKRKFRRLKVKLSLFTIPVRIERRKLYRSDKDVAMLLNCTVRLICHLFFKIQLHTQLSILNQSICDKFRFITSHHQTNKHKNFVQNNQLDASNIQNLFCHKTLYVSAIFCAHHQELPAVHLAIGTFHAGYVAAS